MRSRRIMNNSSLARSGLEKKGKHMKGAQISGLSYTSTNWALMASNLTFSWTALATLFLSNGSETRGITVTHRICSITADISYIDAPVIIVDKCLWWCHVMSAEMFTFHTNVLVSPFFRIVLGQSSGLSNTDHLFIPPVWHQNRKKTTARKLFSVH